MADKTELLLEAERRGILPADKAAILAEARKRGLIQGGEETPEPAQSGPSFDPQRISQSFLDVSNAQAPGVVPETVSREEMARALPVMGGIVGGLAVPGAGWGALALSSLAAGGGAAAGELGKQAMLDEPIDPAKAFKTGAEAGAGNFAGGTLIKGLGWMAKGIFGAGLSSADEAAMAAAKSQGAPYPLSIVKPSPAQRAADKFVLGKLGNQQQANKVTQWLNTKLASLTQKAAVFDDAAAQGQTFFKEMTEPGKNALRKTFDDFTVAVGPDARIPISRTRSAIATALEELQKGGHTKNPLAVRVRSMLKAKGMAAAEMTPAEIDGLMFGIARDTYSRGTNEAVVGVGERLMKALADDADDYAKMVGKSFAPEFAAAQASRSAYRELIKKVPQIATLAKEYGEQGGTKGSIQWMNNLFTSGNGKALAEIRKANPQLYHDLADAWVASKINTFVKFNEQIGTNSLNGAGFRSWVEQNADTIKEVLGKEQFTALDNFSQYAATMTGSAMAKAGQPIPIQNMVFSGGMMTAAGFTSPWLLVPTEGAAFVLARGISDPSSALYKLFTNPATKEAVRAAGKVSGQRIAN